MKINAFEAVPNRAEVRAAGYDEMAEKAISAWNEGRPAAALVWVGLAADEVDVDLVGGAVWLRHSAAPTGGNSPRAVRRTTKLGTCPASIRLETHILGRAPGAEERP